MATRAKHMEVMFSMCQQEFELLQQNLGSFLRQSDRWRQLISGSAVQNDEQGSDDDAENSFVLLAFDGYMTQLAAVNSLMRKLNIHLALNSLDKILGGCVGAKCEQQFGTFKDFVEFRNSVLREQTGGDDLVRQHEAIESASTELIVGRQKRRSEYSRGTTAEMHAATTTTTATTLSVRKVHFATPPESMTPSSPLPLRRLVAEKDLSSFCEGYEFDASITYIEDCKRLVFYICQTNNKDLFDLSNMVHLRRFESLPPPADEVFAISINNDSIMRAVMQPTCTDFDCDRTVARRALLIDFGEVVSLGDHCTLFQVPLSYQRIPAQAIKCVLLGLNYAPNSDDGDFPYLASVLERNQSKRVTFIVIRKLGAVLYVRLFENHPAEKLKVFLMSQKLAKTQWNPFLNTSDEDLTAYNDIDDDVAIPLSALNISETPNWNRKFETKLNVNKITDDFQADISKDTVASSAIIKTAAASNAEVRANSKKPTQSKLNTHADDSIVRITVTHIAEVDCFYGQIDKAELRAPLFWKDDELTPQHELLASPHLNDLVLAQYSKDRFWYRAQVKEIDEEKQIFKVFFVDFGNMETVPLSSLAKCVLSHTDEPYRAHRCRLADVCDITGNDDIRRHHALHLLIVNILNQSIAIKILQTSENELLIRIIDAEFSELPRILIDSGYAKKYKYTKTKTET